MDAYLGNQFQFLYAKKHVVYLQKLLKICIKKKAE